MASASTSSERRRTIPNGSALTRLDSSVLEQRLDAVVRDLAGMREHRPARDLVVEIEHELALRREVLHERDQVLRVHLAGVRGDVPREVRPGQDLHAVARDLAPVNGAPAVVAI